MCIVLSPKAIPSSLGAKGLMESVEQSSFLSLH